MEGAFTDVANHLVSNSAATINAGAADDESILDGHLSQSTLSGPRRRRADDDETETVDDDDADADAGDAESVANGAIANGNLRHTPEHNADLPAHACK